MFQFNPASQKVKRLFAAFFGVFIFTAAIPVNAMHIMEGFLPPIHCIVWAVLSLPFVVIGIKKMREQTAGNRQRMLLMAMAGAYIFVLSALKIPSVTGSCSHPTGTGLAAILFGPFVTAVLGLIVLLFQAILLAHGGLTTLGANTFSMAIFGPILAYVIYKAIAKNAKDDKTILLGVFAASAVGDLLTYVMTAIQLAIAHPDPASGFFGAFGKFAMVFAVTQIPLALSEGILTAILFSFILKNNRRELAELDVLPAGLAA